jgi:hypothetical protein
MEGNKLPKSLPWLLEVLSFFSQSTSNSLNWIVHPISTSFNLPWPPGMACISFDSPWPFGRVHGTKEVQSSFRALAPQPWSLTASLLCHCSVLQGKSLFKSTSMISELPEPPVFYFYCVSFLATSPNPSLWLSPIYSLVDTPFLPLLHQFWYTNWLSFNHGYNPSLSYMWIIWLPTFV